MKENVRGMRAVLVVERKLRRFFFLNKLLKLSLERKKLFRINPIYYKR